MIQPQAPLLILAAVTLVTVLPQNWLHTFQIERCILRTRLYANSVTCLHGSSEDQQAKTDAQLRTSHPAIVVATGGQVKGYEAC